MSDKNQKAKLQKITRQANVLESLKDIGNATGSVFQEDLVKGTSEEFLRQLFGHYPTKKYSGELGPGESIEMGDLFSGKHDENIKLNNQLALERRLASEERQVNTQKRQELQVQLQALTSEVVTLAQTTQGLSEQVQIAAMQVTAEPGPYHLVFFKNLLEFIKSFRKKVENASVWLAATNKRAEKKNYWTTYKKKGSSFLLAPDHYLSRSAG